MPTPSRVRSESDLGPSPSRTTSHWKRTVLRVLVRLGPSQNSERNSVRMRSESVRISVLVCVNLHVGHGPSPSPVQLGLRSECASS